MNSNNLKKRTTDIARKAGKDYVAGLIQTAINDGRITPATTYKQAVAMFEDSVLAATGHVLNVDMVWEICHPEIGREYHILYPTIATGWRVVNPSGPRDTTIKKANDRIRTAEMELAEAQQVKAAAIANKEAALKKRKEEAKLRQTKTRVTASNQHEFKFGASETVEALRARISAMEKQHSELLQNTTTQFHTILRLLNQGKTPAAPQPVGEGQPGNSQPV